MSGQGSEIQAAQVGPGPGRRLGPYESWMAAIGKRYDLPDLMLADALALPAVAEMDVPRVPPNPSDLTADRIRLPDLWRSPGFKTRFVPLVLGPDAQGQPLLGQDLPDLQSDLDALAPALTQGLGAPAGLHLSFPLQSGLMAQAPGPKPAPPPRDPALAGRVPKVILAVIDHGIPFAHAAFRQADTSGTRIDWCWSQGAPAQVGGTVLFGREFRRDQIDAALTRHRGCEDAVYAEAGLLSRPNGPPMPLSRQTSHGAHCLDLLAGSWPHATAPEARIIAVDLPSSPVWETSGFGKDMFLLSALHYIFDRADRIRDLYGTADLPLVINLSYGHSGGAQDGQSLIETAMTELVSARNALAPTVLVLPSGNSFHAGLFAHLTEAHFPPAASPALPREARLQWLAPPDDRTSSFLELWYPPDFQAKDILVELAPPESPAVVSTAGFGPGTQGLSARQIHWNGKVVGRLSLDRPRRDGPWRVTICLAPTATFANPANLIHAGDSHGPAPAGAWTLTFRLPRDVALPETRADGGIGGIQARIQRDTSYGQGLTGARQSRFLDPTDTPFAPQGNRTRQDRAQGAMLRRFGTLNGMAGTSGALIVGGHSAGQDQAAVYSACGLPQGQAPAVRLSAPVELSRALPGRQAAGTRSGITFRASGTSTASPVVARALAESLIGTPMPPDVSLAQILARLATLPQSRPVANPADWPRTGGFVLQR